jgi:hypothetical protein
LSEPQSKLFATAVAAATVPVFLGQTTNETSLILHGLVNTINTQEHVVMDFRTPRPTMVSTSTMPKTPVKMVSIGTMPKTPSPTILPTVPVIDTINLRSPTTSTIDLCSPTAPSTIDLVSPTTIETIGLRSPDTPEGISSAHTPTPQIAPP